jgi:hypothetical protein
MISMDAWRPVPTAYGACSNTESASELEDAVSAIGINSPAGAVIGKQRWISAIRCWFWVRSEARWLRGGRRWPWRRRDDGPDGDLALLLAARSQHDGIDWGRLVCPAARGRYEGIDWDCARDRGESAP